MRKLGAILVLVVMGMGLMVPAMAGGNDHEPEVGECEILQIRYEKQVKKDGEWKHYVDPSDWIDYPEDGMVAGLVNGGTYELDKPFEIGRHKYRYTVVDKRVVADTSEECQPEPCEFDPNLPADSDECVPPTTPTTQPTTTTTVAPTSTSTAPVPDPSFDIGHFCEDGSSWLAVDFEATAFVSIDLYLEDPIGSPDSTFTSSGELRFGVLVSDTYFTFVGNQVGGGTVSQVLNVPATDCETEPTPQPTVVPTSVVTPPTTSPDPGSPTLPFTGLVEDAGYLAVVASGVIGLGWLMVRGRKEDPLPTEPFIKAPK